MMRYSVIAVFSFFAGCGPVSEFDRPALELKSRLRGYSSGGDTKPVFEWVEQYHGEAPSHEMMIQFVRWGNWNQRRMTTLLKSWPPETIQNIIERLQWAAQDSGQRINFQIPDHSAKKN